MLVQNGHSFFEIPEYTLSQFEEAARLVQILLNNQQARFISAAFTAQHGDSKDIQKYIEAITHG